MSIDDIMISLVERDRKIFGKGWYEWCFEDIETCYDWKCLYCDMVFTYDYNDDMAREFHVHDMDNHIINHLRKLNLLALI